MAEDSANRLRFSIEESVWLNKGQEVDEIVSMSLEPDISIVENKHYVSVHGSLKLAGEYRPLPSNGEERDELSLEEEHPLQHQAHRPIDDLRESEEGTIEIEHRFPVDITIPLSRIERLEDIYVVVDGFDYTLPENDCLRLEADISISGMTDEQSHAEDASREHNYEEEVETIGKASYLREEALNEESDNSGEPWHEPFHYEAVRQEVEEDFDRNVKESFFEERTEGPLVEMKPRGLEPEYFDQSNEEETPRLEEEFFSEDDELEPYTASLETEDVEEEVQDSKKPVEYSRKEENALYLTKMLTKDEEDFSRLKMCIIQRGESLDTIAQRYELSATQLIRVNRLENNEVKEGQILYIPVSS